MYIDIIIVCISGLIIGIGTIMLIIYGNRKKTLTHMVNSALEKNLGYEKEDKLFKGTHYKMSLYKYNYIRMSVSVVLVIMGIVVLNKTIVVLAVVGYIAFYPKESICNLKLPFGVIYLICRKKDKAIKNDELLEILSLLKNMMVQLRSKPKGADYIIDYLSGTTELTKPAFLKFLNLIRLGKPEEAEKIFIEEIGTPLAADTVRILIQIDKVEPIALEQNLISIQNEIREIGNTHKQTRNELFSDLILIPIIFTIMFEFLNFLLVAYIGELSGLNYFFNM